MTSQKGIPESVIDEIRERVDIVAVVSDHVLLKKSGANYSGLCPFHNEKTPSFTVHAGKRIFHCFGCGTGGNVFTFLMRIQNIAFPAAVEKLATQVGIDLTPYKGRSDLDFNRAHDLMRDARKFFRKQLAASAQAREYLAKRGLSAATQEEFQIGWAPDDWRLLTEHLRQAGFSDDEMVTYGLARKKDSSVYDYFRGRVVFPIEDEFAKPVGFGGRILGDGQPKYLNSPESVLYNKGRLLFNLHRASPAAAVEGPDTGSLLLVEGYMDAIGLYQAGFKNVVATLGTALTDAQVRKLAKTAKRLVFAYDPDPAGVKATLRALPLLEPSGLSVSMLRLPDGIDPDEFVKDQGPDALRERLTNGQPVESFLFEATRDRHPNWKTPEGKRAALRDMTHVFRQLPSPISQQNFIERVADSFGISEELVRKSFSNAPDKESALDAAASSTRPSVLSPVVQAERTLIYCFMHDISAYRQAEDGLRVAEFRDPYCKRILQLLGGIEQQSGEVSGVLLSVCEDDELRRFITAELMVRPPVAEDGPGEMLADCTRELRKYRLEARKRELHRLVASDGAGDEVLREFKQVTEELQSLLKGSEEATGSLPQAR
ncbi:MAG: DNA primase [Candidatus Wallbacteria bacterium]|nr:DNA primase [Candidatus Wallbacteria bacterium]